MNSLSKLTISAIGMSVTATLALSAPSFAQAAGADAFAAQGGGSAFTRQ